MKQWMIIFSLLTYLINCGANVRSGGKNISVTEGQTEKIGRTLFRVLYKKEYLNSRLIIDGSTTKIYDAIRKKNSKLKYNGNSIFCGEFNPQDLTIRIQYVAKEYDGMPGSILQLKESSSNIYSIYFENEPLLDGIFQETDQSGRKFWKIATFPVGSVDRISNPSNRLDIYTNKFFDIHSITLNKKKIETIQDCIMDYRLQWCAEQPNPKDREWENCDPPGNEYP